MSNVSYELSGMPTGGLLAGDADLAVVISSGTWYPASSCAGGSGNEVLAQ